MGLGLGSRVRFLGLSETEGSTRRTYTGLIGGLEHLKIETRLIDERFVCVTGECVTLK
jgi:hypothetical protein